MNPVGVTRAPPQTREGLTPAADQDKVRAAAPLVARYCAAADAEARSLGRSTALQLSGRSLAAKLALQRGDPADAARCSPAPPRAVAVLSSPGPIARPCGHLGGFVWSRGRLRVVTRAASCPSGLTRGRSRPREWQALVDLARRSPVEPEEQARRPPRERRVRLVRGEGRGVSD
jgi:hypothetical protein